MLVPCTPGMQSPCLQCCWNAQHSRLAPVCHAACACTPCIQPAAFWLQCCQLLHTMFKQHSILSAALLSLLGELLAFHGVLLWKGMSTYDYILARRELAQREAVATGSFHERAAPTTNCCRKLRILPDVTGNAGGGNGQATGGAGATVSICHAGLNSLHSSGRHCKKVGMELEEVKEFLALHVASVQYRPLCISFH